MQLRRRAGAIVIDQDLRIGHEKHFTHIDPYRRVAIIYYFEAH
jgi:hypothetical protein